MADARFMARRVHVADGAREASRSTGRGVLLIGFRRQQRVDLTEIVGLDADHPALSIRLPVDKRRLRSKRVIACDDGSGYGGRVIGLPLTRRRYLHREDACEEIGEHGENDEPHADGEQDPARPPLDRRGLGLNALEGPLLCVGDCERGRKDQAHHDDGGHHEGGERRAEPADCQRVSGQTGQNRTGSSKAGKHVAKPEHGESSRRPLAAQARLPACERLRQLAHRME